MIDAAKTFLTQTVLPAGLVLATGFNAVMAVNGPDGRRAEAILSERIEAQRATLAETRARTAHLSDRADRLMLATLDEDLLEERLRVRLGLTRPGEYRVRMEDLDGVIASGEAGNERRFAALRRAPAERG